MGKSILITGVSGYFGAALAKYFLAEKSVSKVIGTDLKESDISHEKFIFADLDSQDADAHKELIKKHSVDHIFHLAFIMGEHVEKCRVKKTNINLSLAMLEAANDCDSVKKIVFLGSVSAYGAHFDNKLYLKEDAPLKASTIQYGMNKKFVEKEIAKVRPFLRDSLDLVMLRVCTIVGESARGHSFVSSFVKSPVGLSVLGHECPLQFVHEKDLCKVFDKVLRAKRVSGVYNVAPKEYTSMVRLSRRLGKFILYPPYTFLYSLFWLLFKLKPDMSISHNSVSYIAYPIIVDSSRLEKALNFNFEYSSEEAFIACAKALDVSSE